MKKFPLLVAALVVCLETIAQSFPTLNKFHGEILVINDLRSKEIAKNKITSMTRTYTLYKKNGRARNEKDITTFNYNDTGYLISYTECNDKGEKKEKYEYRYQDSLLSGFSYEKNNKLKRTYELKRNEKQYITDKILRNGKGQISSRQHYEYDPQTGNLSKTSIFDKKGKEISSIEYSYYDKKNLKEAKEYKNGKLKKVWNYTCDLAGASEEKVKKTQVCKNISTDENGNRVETNRIVNHNGEVELRINTFDKNDRFIAQKVYDDMTHRLRIENMVTWKDGQETSTYKLYSKKGKETYSSKAVYSTSHKLLLMESHFGKKNLVKIVYTYNDKDLVINSVTFDQKNRKISENIHTYY